MVLPQRQQDTTTAEAQLKEQTLQREKDKASNSENIQDLAESVDALDRAVKTLESRSGDVKQAGAALLQVSALTDVPDAVQRSIAAFIEMSTDGPQANFNDGGEEHAQEGTRHRCPHGWESHSNCLGQV